jgi:hypothetical protein
MRANLHLRSHAAAAAGLLLAGAVACSDTPPAEFYPDGGPPNVSHDAGEDVEPRPTPASVETVAPASVRAGETLNVTCLARDEHGEEVGYDASEFRIRYAPAAAVERREDGTRIAVRAGDLEAVCSLPEHALLDEQPPLIEVRPGPAALVSTSVDRAFLTAGEHVEASCAAFDAWGNSIEDAGATLRVVPQRGENQINELVATLVKSGAYELVCDRPGAASEGAAVDVTPGPPASIVIARVPSRPIYGIGEIVTIDSLVVDSYGNAVPEAQVSLTSIPAADVAVGSRLRYLSDGVYNVTATVVGPAPAGTEPPSATTTITVDGSGPTIACNFPQDGAILERTPGVPITFEGAAADLSGVKEVRVNGELVGFDGNGNFSATVPTRFGINFVRLSSVDELDRETTRTCSFLVAEEFSEEDRDLDDAVAMALNAAAVDDGTRGGDITSLADVLYVVLNSDGLHQAIHEMLLEHNPLKPMSCDQNTWFGCALRSEFIYLDSEFPGPNDVSIDLFDGGFGLFLEIPNAALDLYVHGTALGIGFSSTGTMTVDRATLFVPFDAFFAAGRPRVAVRSDEVQVNIGSIDSDFGGFSGWFIDIIISLAQGTVRGLLEEQISGLITESLAEILDDLLAHLDIGALATTIEVPRIGGGDPIPLRFDPGLSSLDASGDRLLFGLSTRFSAPVENARSSPGAPIALPLGPRDPGRTSPMGVALHTAILNQVMHALWRAGFFDAAMQIGEEGEMAVELDTGLPPVVVVAGTDDVELSLGNVTARLSDPQLFPEPVVLGLGLRARVRVAASAEAVDFYDFALEEIHVTSYSVSLDRETREILEGVLGDVLTQMIGSALDEALPALPVPSFALPEAVVEFGLPEGSELGLEDASLLMQSPFVLLRGAFGLRSAP